MAAIYGESGPLTLHSPLRRTDGQNVDSASDAEALAAADFAAELTTCRERRGLSKRALAEQMAYDRSYIIHIENGNLPPTEDFTRRAEQILSAGGALWSRWRTFSAVRNRPRSSAAQGTDHDLRNATFLAWIADRSAMTFQEAYNAVGHIISDIEAEPPAIRHAQSQARSRIGQHAIADAVATYYSRYDQISASLGFYRASVGIDHHQINTSVLVKPSWIETKTDLAPSRGSAHYAITGENQPVGISEAGIRAALMRLAEVEVSDTVLVNNPLYRLLDINVQSDGFTATFGISDFLSYALTNDLLESELVDLLAEVAAPAQLRGGVLPLRDLYLPTVAAAGNLAERHCVGGAVSLLAIARDGNRDDDYMLLIQERSSRVLNVTGRLAVIPKAFHQPVAEEAAEVDLIATLEREIEEELLGRHDLELLSTGRLADPLHSGRLSEPMRWLLDRHGSEGYRVECTGFGINMVTGNYEFACLTIVDDPEWWHRFGHQVEANWETAHLRRYSSLDTNGIANLIKDPKWSNEGLFAFLQGLRRLPELGSRPRVAVPTVEVEI